LLGPEHKAGTISNRDFALAKRYIPRNNTYPFLYNLVFPAAVGAWYYGTRYRRPSWPGDRIGPRVLMGSLVTLALVFSAQNIDNTLFLLRLDNAWSFAQAVTRVRTYPNALFPVESPVGSSDGYQIHFEGERAPETRPEPRQAQRQQPAVPPSTHSGPQSSRWAEIRKAHIGGGPTPSSSWERIRQANTPSSSTTTTS